MSGMGANQSVITVHHNESLFVHTVVFKNSKDHLTEIIHKATEPHLPLFLGHFITYGIKINSDLTFYHGIHEQHLGLVHFQNLQSRLCIAPVV